MASLKLCMCDGRIVDHLRRGGSLGDLVGRQLVVKFIHLALQDARIAQACSRFGFDADDLCRLYSDMVTALLPNPAIKGGGTMLAASLVFIEPFRIETMLSQMSHEIIPHMDVAARREVIRRHAEGNAQVIWDSHSEARGAASFPINSNGGGAPAAGCATIIVLSITFFVSSCVLAVSGCDRRDDAALKAKTSGQTEFVAQAPDGRMSPVYNSEADVKRYIENHSADFPEGTIICRR